MEEDEIFRIALKMHAVSGGIALFGAPLAMIVRKGGNAHRFWGKVFFYSMAVVCLTAVYTGFVRPNYVMALVAVFSFHMCAAGYRALYLKKLHEGLRPQRMDLLIHGIAGVFSLGLLIYSAGTILAGHGNSFSYIFTVFGMIGIFNVLRYMRRFKNPTFDRRQWFYDHMSGFLGAYIATLSAFSAVNFEFLPVLVRWLWPTAIGVPLMIVWIRYYRGKFEKGKRVQQLVHLQIK